MVSSIKVARKTIRGVFLDRPNRFLAFVKVGNMVLPSFVPNPGRMLELLTPGTEVILREIAKENRKTSYDLVGVLYDGQVVSVDSRVPNKLVLEALRKRDIEKLSEYDKIRPEYSYGHTRFDFLLTNKLQSCLLEVKSCTLVKDGRAMFPDAKTERGRRHLMDLMKAKGEGYRACVLFIVQRTDVSVFIPNDETDPQFGKALRDAAARGVEVYAYRSEFVGNRITLKGKVKVELDRSLIGLETRT